MRQIIVSVAEDGKVRIDAVGFKGNACEKATAAIEKALGKKTGGAKKPEFFQTSAQQAKQGH